MLRRLLALMTSLALITPPAALAQSSPAADLEKGVRLTREGEYKGAVATLQAVIKQLGAAGAAADLARAQIYLGVAHLGLGQEEAAKTDFQAALRADPKRVLSTAEFPPKVIKMFEAARSAARLPVVTGPSIDHSPLKCLEADLFPEVRAGIASPASVPKSRVYFKAHQHPDWYYVEMASAQVPAYLGMLPKPLPGTEKVDYYVYALDNQLQTAQTAEYDPAVSKTCARDKTAAAPGKQGVPRITLFGTREGQAPIPPGFDKAGIVAFVTVAGAMIAGAALGDGAAAGTTGAASGAGTGAGDAGTGAAAAGAGLSLTTIGLIAGGVAVAGIGVAAAAGGGKEDPLAKDDDGDGVSENAGDCNDGNPQVNPNGTLNFSNARFATPTFTCPEGASNSPDDTDILIDAVNNRCAAATVSSASVSVTIEVARDTFNRPGQVFNLGNVPFSPSSVSAGSSTALRLEPVFTCTNPRGPSGGFNEISARITLNTSAGTFTLQTTNRHRTSFPIYFPGLR